MTGHQTGGLVISEQARGLSLIDHLTIDGKDIARLDLDRRGRQDRPIQRHAPGFD